MAYYIPSHRVPHAVLQTRDDSLLTYFPQGYQDGHYRSELRHDICIILLIRTWIRTAGRAREELTPVSSAAHLQIPTAARVPNAAWVPNVPRWQFPTTPQDPTAAQVPTAAQEALNNDSEMWNMYLDEVKEEDNRITDAWKEDASSILVFVSLILLIIY
jgi:Family of unknown function (DUF6535)